MYISRLARCDMEIPVTWRSRAVGSVRWQEENCGLGQGTELEHSVLHLLYPPTLSGRRHKEELFRRRTKQSQPRKILGFNKERGEGSALILKRTRGKCKLETSFRSALDT
eukprot:XP_025005931.1 uncharacterized protein LOC112532341 [Gallus gallus]